MYRRALPFNRYSRLAALYSILETGRQPSLGGKGFAIADAHASNDAVMTSSNGQTVLKKCHETPHLRRYARQLLQQRLRVLQIARVEAFRKPAGTGSQQFARFAPPWPGRARGAPCSLRRAVPRILSVVDARPRVRARKRLLLSRRPATAKSAQLDGSINELFSAGRRSAETSY